jgi:hypothetical protein
LGETDYPCGGDEATEIYLAATGKGLEIAHQRRNRNYRLDLLTVASS